MRYSNPSVTPRHMFFVCASNVPTIALISLRSDSVAMVISLPSQVTLTCGNRTLLTSWPLGPVTESCVPSSLILTPSGILTFLMLAMIPPLIDVPEQFAADAFLACLHMRHDAARGGKDHKPEVLAGQVLLLPVFHLIQLDRETR